MKSHFVKRFLVINSHKVPASIESAFWTCLEEIAQARATTAEELLATIYSANIDGCLSSAIRAYVLSHYRIQMRGIDEFDDAARSCTPTSAFENATNARRPRWLN